MTENRLKLDDHLLVCLPLGGVEKYLSEYLYLQSHFCGRMICPDPRDLSETDFNAQTPQGCVYLCGDLQPFNVQRKSIPQHVKLIKELSINADAREELEVVSLGEVPINLHNVAVYYRKCLSSGSQHSNYFHTLQTKHRFQSLTESTKPNTSFRKGIYLSNVETTSNSTSFHLLRCSTNLSGPTLAFAKTDREIVAQTNKLTRPNFEQETEFNHVLAQVYENSITIDETKKIKENRAKIKSHSDKTKDMPVHGLIAFCTFYSSDLSECKTPAHDRFDRCYKDASVLTQLRFRLKSELRSKQLVKDFRVTLYPDSILLIPLSTNRLYTHEIVPPQLPVERFPTRLGYVVRCSKTRAVFRDGKTFIQGDEGKGVELRRPTVEEIGGLRELYREENATARRVEYPPIYFSLNEGDYEMPLVG